MNSDQRLHEKGNSNVDSLQSEFTALNLQPLEVFDKYQHVGEGEKDEDRLVTQRFQIRETVVDFYAVFDGHGGKQVSQRLHDEFPDFLVQSLPVYNPSSSTLSPDEIDETRRRIRRTFGEFDKIICSAVGIPKRLGSTAIVGLRIKNQVFIANLGDSKAEVAYWIPKVDSSNNLLGYEEKAVRTKDHTVFTNNDEKDRVLKAEGRIITLKRDPTILIMRNGRREWLKVERVEGTLIPSRSFGDCYFKRMGPLANDKYMSTPYTWNGVVSAIPDLNVFEIVPGHTTKIVLASDGLWDKMEPGKALYAFSETNAAKSLVKYAISKDSKDDISIIMDKF